VEVKKKEDGRHAKWRPLSALLHVSRGHFASPPLIEHTAAPYTTPPLEGGSERRGDKTNAME